MYWYFTDAYYKFHRNLVILRAGILQYKSRHKYIFQVFLDNHSHLRMKKSYFYL